MLFYDPHSLLFPKFKAPRRQSRIPNLKGPSPLPGSQAEFQEQVDFFLYWHRCVLTTQKFGDIPWHCGDPHRYGAPKKGDSWNKCHKLTEKYDNEMCDAWKEEVDKLLIFVRDFFDITLHLITYLLSVGWSVLSHCNRLYCGVI